MVSNGARAGLLAAAILLLGGASCGGNSWDQAVADANRDNEPLIVEFYATWCRPCLWFEANVLSQPSVARELERVHFRRFDFDSTSGRNFANRLGVRAIPTILAVDGEGNVIGGLRGATNVERFLGFLRWSHEQRSKSEPPEGPKLD